MSIREEEEITKLRGKVEVENNSTLTPPQGSGRVCPGPMPAPGKIARRNRWPIRRSMFKS